VDTLARLRPHEILFCSDFPWGYHNPEAAERVAHLARRGHRIVYVEMFGIRDPRPRHVARALRALQPGRATGDRAQPLPFEVISPKLLPPRRSPGVRWLNRRWLTRQLVGRLRSAHEAIVWVRFPSPELVDVVEACDPRMLVYELVDEHRYSMTSARHRRLYDEAERALLARAGLVLASSEPIRARLDRLRPGTVLFQAAAVELDLFAEAAATVSPQPRTALYLGGIDRRIDVNMLRDAAARLPDWRFRVIGPAERAPLRVLEGVPNIELPGQVSPAEAPALIASAAVCLLPYAQTDFNRTLFPVKLIHYMAAGRPIATAPVEAIAPFREVVELGEGGAGFADAIKRAAASDGPEDRRHRQERAGDFSWESRTDLLEAHLDAALNRSGGAGDGDFRSG
jgi:glycosyltransferase involved in cell wall biosynthesis